jgi:hypothetical protein
MRNLHGDKRQGLLTLLCTCCCSRQDLKALLAEYRDYPAVAVNWVWFGYNGRMTRPAQPGMLRWYTQCNPKPVGHIKVIVNSKYVAAIDGGHPHNVWYKCAPIAMHAMQESIALHDITVNWNRVAARSTMLHVGSRLFLFRESETAPRPSYWAVQACSRAKCLLC